jgi:PAS domain S-box-containing protein
MKIIQINTRPAETIRERMRKVAEGKRQFYRMQHRLANGSVRDVEIYSGPIDFAGKTALYSIVHDVTERMQAEKALKRSEDRFRKAFHTSPDAISINRLADGVYVSINRGFTQILGYSEADVLGKTSLELNIWADPADRMQLVEGLREKGEMRNLEARFRAKSGTIIHGLMSASVIDIDGVPHIISVTRDITDRKAAEERLRESEAHYRALFTAITDAVFVHEVLEDGSPGMVLEVNDVACTRLGYTRSELLRLRPQDIDDVRKLGSRILAGETVQFEQVHVAKDGRRIPVEIRAQRLTVGGRIMILSLVRDITERKQAETTMRENEAQLRESIEFLPTPIGIADRSGRVLYFNAAFIDQYGWRTEDTPTLGAWSAKVYPDPVYREAVVRLWNEDAAVAERQGTSTPTREYRMICKDGTEKDVEITMHPTGGRLITSFVDVTGRKRSEEKISKYSRDLQRLLTVSRDMTATTDIASLYRAAVQTAADLLQFDFSTVMSLSEDGTGLTIMETVGFPRTMVGQFSLVEGPMRCLISGRKRVSRSRRSFGSSTSDRPSACP